MGRQLATFVEPHYKRQRLGLIVGKSIVDASLAYARYLDHLGPTQEARWKDLGDPALSLPLKQELVAGVEAEAAGRDLATLRCQRDQALIAILDVLKRQDVYAASSEAAPVLEGRVES
jgi:hypothetical protein